MDCNKKFYRIKIDFLLYLAHKFGPLAQLVEQETLNLLVVGSTPTRPTSIINSVVGLAIL